MTTIINKTLQGISWNFKSQLITQIINFLVGVFLMRWLVPGDFGKFAMVFVVVSFLQIFRDAGFTAALIQKKKLTQADISTAFWFQILIAFIVSILLLSTGTLFNTFYEEVVLDKIAFWLSIDFLIGSLGLVPTALLRKDLKFKQLFKIQISALVLSSIIGITMVLNGMEYFSLVGKILAWTVINSIGAFILVNLKPNLHFSNVILKDLLRFGIPATGNHLLSYLVRNTDDFFIGRVIGASSLGIYNRAYALMLLPMANITSVLQNVLFSTWSKIQDDITGIKKMYIEVSGMIAFVAFPLMTLLSIFAEQIVTIVLGEKWMPMVDTLRILSFVGMFQSVGSLVGLVFLVFDKNKLLFKINLVTSILTISFVVWSIYAYKSIEITALVYGLTSLSFIYPTFYYAGKLMGATFKELAFPLVYPFLFSMISGLIGWFIFQITPFDSNLIKLLLSIPSALVLYLILCTVSKIQVIKDLFKVIKYYKLGKDE